MAAAAVLASRPVGALACQKDSYLRSLETEVISCVRHTPAKEGKKKSNAEEKDGELWEVEFTDSVLFPEGGGQPSDHGILEPLSSPDDGDAEGDTSADPIDVKNVQRSGLRSITHSPRYLSPGSKVRQRVDHERRWDHMQQHTGQHLLSAVMDTYPDLETLGWGMGSMGSSNYVDLPRTPSRDEMRRIEARCNEIIRDNQAIDVVYPEGDEIGDGVEKGVIRIIKIGNVDANPCCGTHLRQTSHIELILLQSTQTVRAKECRMSFVAGERAVRLAASSAEGIRSIAYDLSCGTSADDVVAAVEKIKNDRAELRRKEVRLLKEMAKFEGERLGDEIRSGRNVFLHRAAEGMEFVNMVLFELKQVLKESRADVAAVLAVGEEKKAGQVVIVGSSAKAVEGIVERLNDSEIEVKGNGKGERWQGKVVEWKKGDLKKLEALAR